MREVLIVVGDAAETLDTFYPFYRLQEAGFRPVVTGPEARRYQTVLHEAPPGWEVTRETEGYTIAAEVAFRDVDPEGFAGIYFSGGRAPEYLRYHEALLALTRRMFELDRPVATVCHGVEIPARAGCLAGRRVTTVPKCRFDVETAGAEYVDLPCVVDRNLVSGRTYHDHGSFVGPWIGLLGGVHGPGPTDAPPPT